DGSASLVDRLISACPDLRVLATSREPLRIPGERIQPVPPLSLPDRDRAIPLAELRQYAAVRLFVDRAHAADPSFGLTSRNAPLVLEICWRLGGIPLAIELAAARVRALGVDELLARLDDCLSLLTAGNRVAPVRQQTLRATLDWSFALLAPVEQALFCKLGVFAGSFTIEAAEAI